MLRLPLRLSSLRLWRSLRLRSRREFILPSPAFLRSNLFSFRSSSLSSSPLRSYSTDELKKCQLQIKRSMQKAMAGSFSLPSSPPSPFSLPSLLPSLLRSHLTDLFSSSFSSRCPIIGSPVVFAFLLRFRFVPGFGGPFPFLTVARNATTFFFNFFFIFFLRAVCWGISYLYKGGSPLLSSLGFSFPPPLHLFLLLPSPPLPSLHAPPQLSKGLTRLYSIPISQSLESWKTSERTKDWRPVLSSEGKIDFDAAPARRVSLRLPRRAGSLCSRCVATSTSRSGPPLW